MRWLQEKVSKCRVGSRGSRGLSQKRLRNVSAIKQFARPVRLASANGEAIKRCVAAFLGPTMTPAERY